MHCETSPNAKRNTTDSRDSIGDFRRRGRRKPAAASVFGKIRDVRLVDGRFDCLPGHRCNRAIHIQTRESFVSATWVFPPPRERNNKKPAVVATGERARDFPLRGRTLAEKFPNDFIVTGENMMKNLRKTAKFTEYRFTTKSILDFFCAIYRHLKFLTFVMLCICIHDNF